MADASLQIGNGNWGVKTSLLLGYNVVSNRYNPIEIGVTRETLGSRTNVAGIIDYKDNNIARINYESGVGSLLLEPQRTNLTLYSDQFDFSSVWANTELNISGTPPYINQGISPTNTLTADKIIPNTVNGVHRFVYGPTITVDITSPYTISIFMKKNDFNYCFFRENINGTTDNSFFNLQTVTLGTIGVGRTATIKDYGNGWIRCSVTATTTTTSINVLGIGVTDTNGSTTVIGDNIKFNYLWGAQLEKGSYPTSYIPTTISAVTRNADTFLRNNIYTNGLITSVGGTWFIELNNNVSYIRDAVGSGIYIGEDASSSIANGKQSLSIRCPLGTVPLAFNYWNGSAVSINQSISQVNFKLAVKFTSTSFDVFVNGVKILSNQPITWTLSNVQFLNGLNDVPKYIKSTMLFPTPLTDTECISLTQ